MSKNTRPVVELTVVQQEVVRAKWDTVSQLDIVREIFLDSALDLNSPQGRAVKKFIASIDGAVSEKPKELSEKQTELTPEQKTNIEAMLDTDSPPPVKEIVKTLFPDVKNITPLHREWRLVYNHVRTLNEEKVDIWDEPVEFRRYRAPVTFSGMIGMCNRYIGNPINPGKALYDAANIKKIHENNLKAMLSYMQTTKFILQGSQYDRKADRELFEETFVRQIHDKAADLIPEEVDMYIALASETVEISKMERDVRQYERVVKDYMDGDFDGEKRATLSKPFVDALTALRVKWGESKKRHSDIIKSVAGSRKDRVSARDDRGVLDIVTLIQMWCDEQEREKMLIIAQKEHEADGKEFDRIETVDDIIARMMGMTREEAMTGL